MTHHLYHTPATNMPDYSKWSREDLEVTVRQYHRQVVQMRHDMQTLRNQLADAKTAQSVGRRQDCAGQAQR